MKRVVKSSLALSLVFVMVLTSGLVVNASDLQPVEKVTDEDGNVTVNKTTNKTEYDAVVIDSVNSVLVSNKSIKEIEKAEELNVEDITTNDDNIFKSCHLIVTSKEPLEFKDGIFDGDIVSVQHIDTHYIVTYKSIEATEKAYNELTALGLDVEIDTISDNTEGVENKNFNNSTVNAKDIAKTNENRETDNIDKINEEKDKDKNKDIVVAVLDTGLNDGEDIFKNRLVEGQNFIDNGDTNDINGHGTAMARIVLDSVENINNKDTIKIMPIKVSNDDGKGTTLSAYKGIKYAIEKKVDVINISMSGFGESKLLQSAINEAFNAGIPVIVSAGNNNKDIKDYTPANIKSAFTIGSAYEYNEEYHKEMYSNYGNGIDYVTSGHYDYIRRIDNEDVITNVNGTSISSAYVTSYVAMLKQMALSDDNEDNDALSISDIDNSLYLSAIELENTELFGKGYLTKDNIVLDTNKHKDKTLPVDYVENLNEEIELEVSEAFITSRDFRIQNLPKGGNWWVQMYVMQDYGSDDPVAESKWVTETDTYHWIGTPGGGTIHIRKIDDTTVQIVYDHVDVTGYTPWVKVGIWGNDRITLDPSERVFPAADYWNSAQNKTEEVHYKWDEYYNNYVDCYAGIGTWDYDWGNGRGCFPDIKFNYHWNNIKVNYHAHGGTVLFLGQDQNKEVEKDVEYDANGYNGWSNTNLGRGFTAKREGYVFKGWYFSERDDRSWEESPKLWVTDLVDYANRNTAPGDLYDQFAAYDYNVKDLSNHLWNSGVNEPNRKINGELTSTYKRSYTDWGNPIDGVYGQNPYDNFDNFRQLLKDGKGICGLDSVNFGLLGGWQSHPLAGQDIVAHAVWEKENVPGFEVTWDTNGGKWTDGSKNAITFSYSASGQNELLPNYYVGIDSNASPTKDGKVLKGWYFTYDDGAQRKVEQVTDMIDYYNRNSDLQPEGICTGFGMINMNALWRHWNDFGKGEHRQIAERARTLNDIDNKDSDYDYGNQLLKPGQCFCNTFVEGSYDLCNYKLRAYAIYEDADYTISYDMNGKGAVNNPRNPTAYKKNTEVIHIYKPNDWSDDKYQYTFAGWKCDKDVDIFIFHCTAGTIIGDSGDVLDINAGDYGNLKFTAQWKKSTKPSPEDTGDWSYNIIWDSNGNWNDGRNDTEKLNYDHSYYNKYHYYTEEEGKDGKTHKKWHTETTHYKGKLATYEVPSTPRTATLYFDDPNAHGNTSNISASIKTQKRFDGWKKIKTTGNRTPTKTIWKNSEGEYEKEYHETKYRADSPWKFPGKFRDMVDAGKTATLQAQWTRLPTKLPGVSKPGYDFLGWQINGTGRIYREGEEYIVGADDNDVKFVAVWRRNQGKVVYNPNGAVNDYNQQYSPVTDNSYTMLNGSYTTKDGDIFGKEVTEDGFIKNETTKNKVGTTITNKYIINDGDIINTLGTKDKLSTFQGWSSINYARHDTPNILYDGYVPKFMNIYYDVTAVNKLKIANPPNPYTINNVKTRANQIVTHRNNNISKWKSTPRLSEIGDWFEKLTTSRLYYDPSLEGNGIVNMYATWDEFPAFIEVDDVTILSSDLEKQNIFETDAQIQKRIETRIMRDIIVTDKEEENLGRLPYGQLKKLTGDDKGKGKVGIEVVDLDLDAMREIGTGMTGGILVTIQATDSAGHITKTQIMLYVNQVTSEEDLTGEMKDNYTRFITKDSYTATYENGGPYSKSKWRLVDAYRNELLTSFDNLDKLVSIDNSSQPIPQNTEVWYFTHDDVEATREFVKNNGIGKSKKPTGLAEYQNTIKNNKTNKVKTIVNEEPK